MGEGTNLPPGFRFFPSDEELVVHFLYRKAARLPCHPDIVPTIDLPLYDPWDLNGKALQGGNYCWYFFTHRGQNRATANGYWHLLGSDETIASGNRDVGVKKTFKYYLGQSPDGIKTKWIMHEYHLFDGVLGAIPGCSSSSSSSSSRRSKRGQTRTESNKWVICRVYESAGGSQASLHDDSAELSCLDEVFLSLDDYDEVSFSNV